MDVADFLANSIDQDRGRTLVIRDPWSGELLGLSFQIAGPDSDVQRKARIAMMDDLADLANPDGTISAANREAARIKCLASCVVGWDVTENGVEIPFEHKHVVRVLRASSAIQQQVDAFAGDRANFKPSRVDADKVPANTISRLDDGVEGKPCRFLFGGLHEGQPKFVFRWDDGTVFEIVIADDGNLALRRSTAPLAVNDANIGSLEAGTVAYLDDGGMEIRMGDGSILRKRRPGEEDAPEVES